MAGHEHNPRPRLIPNPFIKKRNREWTLDIPPGKKQHQHQHQHQQQQRQQQLEEHEPRISPPRLTNSDDNNGDNLLFADLFARTLEPYPVLTPRMARSAFTRLYKTNAGSAAGAHFVVHQHDHPVAGPHYDLRLQINPTSSVSFAIMYGPPGDPNSAHRGRTAVETRVHALASHVAEGASRDGGSLLIWDTGTYRVLDPPSSSTSTSTTTTTTTDSDSEGEQQQQQQERLHAAFARRKIRLSLRGERLPRPYVVYLRLTKAEDAAGQARVAAGRGGRRRRSRTRRGGATADSDSVQTTSSEESDASAGEFKQYEDGAADGDHYDEITTKGGEEEEEKKEEKEEEEKEEEKVHRANAYRGATNSIGSVYQRRWYLSLDASGSGFVRRGSGGKKTTWERRAGPETETPVSDGAAGTVSPRRLRYPFYVGGPQLERSVVTGRLAADIFRDEGLEAPASRKGWRAVMN